MEFWGIEVKAKEQHNVAVDQGSIIHVSQATLGEKKKDTENVTVHVQVGEKKLVLGMLSQKTPQLSFDLVFDEDFVISHNWKNGSIHLMGYTAEDQSFGSDSEFASSEEEDEELPVAKENGQIAVGAPKALAGKPKEDKAKAVAKDETEEEESSEDDSDDSDDSDESSDEQMPTAESDSDDSSDDDDSEESEEEKPVEVAVSGKKRSSADVKSSSNAKKAKIATPQKTDGKKGVVHPATPYPKGGKTPGTDKAAAAKTPKSAAVKTPKSGGSGSDLSCGPCKKTFKSDSAFESHNKAKHAAK